MSWHLTFNIWFLRMLKAIFQIIKNFHLMWFFQTNWKMLCHDIWITVIIIVTQHKCTYTVSAKEGKVNKQQPKLCWRGKLLRSIVLLLLKGSCVCVWFFSRGVNVNKRTVTTQFCSLHFCAIWAAVFFLFYWPHLGLKIKICHNWVYALTFHVTFLLLTTNTAL